MATAMRRKKSDKSNEVVWVAKRYTPSELRSTAPVSRYKIFNPTRLPEIPDAWKKPVTPPIQHYSRHKEEKSLCTYQQSTRCEEWSTLRQILPSKGRTISKAAPRWGCGQSDPRQFSVKPFARFPITNSPMTQYADDMHVTNRLFRLH